MECFLIIYFRISCIIHNETFDLFQSSLFTPLFPRSKKSFVSDLAQHIEEAQAEINNRTNVDPTLNTNFRLSEFDCRRTVEMITMYCVGTTPVSNVVSILVTNIFSTLAVNISKILLIYFYY